MEREKWNHGIPGTNGRKTNGESGVGWNGAVSEEQRRFPAPPPPLGRRGGNGKRVEWGRYCRIKFGGMCGIAGKFDRNVVECGAVRAGRSYVRCQLWMTQPFQGCPGFGAVTQGSSLDSQPWVIGETPSGYLGTVQRFRWRGVCVCGRVLCGWRPWRGRGSGGARRGRRGRARLNRSRGLRSSRWIWFVRFHGRSHQRL